MPALVRGMGNKQLLQMLEELAEKQPHFMEDLDELSSPPPDEQFSTSSRVQSADIDAKSEAETRTNEAQCEEESSDDIVLEVFGPRRGSRRDFSPLPAVQNIDCPRPVRNPYLDTRLSADTVLPKPQSPRRSSASALSCPRLPRRSMSPLPTRPFSSNMRAPPRRGMSPLPARLFSSNMRAAEEDLSRALEHRSLSRLILKSSRYESSSGEETFFWSSLAPTDRSSSRLMIPQNRISASPTYQSPPRLMTLRGQLPLYTSCNSNVYRGNLVRSDGRKVMVAVKLLRIIRDDPAELDHFLTDYRRLVCAGRSWQKLSHPNILPFFGVYDIKESIPAFVTPFCHLGNVGNYTRSHPLSNRDRLVHDVASGLKYLHENDIVHGDLKPQNVLIDKRGVACVCDWGISQLINPEGVTVWSAASSTYIAPELLILVHPLTPNPIYPKPTQKSDVYSFGLLSLEILTSGPPKGRGGKSFHEAKLLEGFRPQKAQYDFSEIGLGMWSVLDKCWDPDPQLRLTTRAIWESPPFRVQRSCGSTKRLISKA